MGNENGSAAGRAQVYRLPAEALAASPLLAQITGAARGSGRRRHYFHCSCSAEFIAMMARRQSVSHWPPS
jgi:hypothetical protein